MPGSVLLLSLIHILLGLAGTYGYQVSVYQNHFLPGTRINELDCGKMTAKEAEDAYRKETETYQLTLTFRGDESETIAGKDFDYTYQDDGEIESFLKKQNPFLWMKYWFEQSEYELKRGIVYDEGKLEKKLNNLSHLSEESQEAPVDAKIVYKEDQFLSLIHISSCRGAIVGIPPLQYWVSNQQP